MAKRQQLLTKLLPVPQVRVFQRWVRQAVQKPLECCMFIAAWPQRGIVLGGHIYGIAPLKVHIELVTGLDVAAG